MKKSIILLVLFFGFKVNSQQNTGILIPYLEGQKYGFSDESGNLIIAAKYDLAYPFFASHDLTMAVKSGKASIINRKGRKVKNASSDYISESEKIGFGLAFKFKPEGIAIDVECLSDSCPEFAIYAKLDNMHLLDKMGDLYFVRAENKVFLINSKGKSKTKEFDKIRHYISSEIEYAITEDNSLNKMGLINNKGEQLLECVYDGVVYDGKGIFELSQTGKTYPFKVAYNENYVPADLPQRDINKNRVISRREGKFGVSDSSKNMILPYRYKKLYPMGNDNYLFWNTDSVGIVRPGEGIVVGNVVKANVNGVIGTSDFVPYMPYTNNLAFLHDGQYWHLVGTDGKCLIDDIEGIFVDFQKVAGNIAGIVLKGKAGVIDNSGKIIINFSYEKIFCLSANNTFVVKEGDKWKWIDSNGRIIYSEFDEFKYLINNYLFVRMDNSWFYVSDKGKVFKK